VIAALILSLLASAAPAQSPLVDARTATSEAAAAPDAQWSVAASEREVGEPFDATLVVRHAADERVEVDEDALAGDASWVELAPGRLSAVHAEGAARVTQIVWSLASLEPGERDLPIPIVWRVGADGARRPVSVAAQSSRFVGVLGEAEDEPRAPLGFRPLEPELESSNATAAYLGGAVALLLGVLAWTFLRRRKREPTVAPPSALEQLSQLAERDLESREAVRDAYYRLTMLLRREVDARANSQRTALTDAEWIAAAANELPAEAARELAAVLRDAEGVKYGGAHPTHWAARESLAQARRVLESLTGVGAAKELAA